MEFHQYLEYPLYKNILRTLISQKALPSFILYSPLNILSDLLDVDVDALIAQFTIPPPPTSTMSDSTSSGRMLPSSGAAYRYQSSSTSSESNLERLGDGFRDSGMNRNSKEIDSDADLAHLIIPPPPESSESVDDIEEVSPPPPPPPPPPRRSSSSDSFSLSSSKGKAPPPPPSSPASTSFPASHAQNKQHLNQKAPSTDEISKASGRHRRSSSLDISAVIAAQSEPLRGSKDNVNLESVKISPENSSLSPSADGIAGDSPATVSQKLHLLLQSLPNFGPGLPPREPRLVRSGSLRMYHRSASLDTDLHKRARRALPDTPSSSAASNSQQQSSQTISSASSRHNVPAHQQTSSQQHSMVGISASSSDKQALRKTVSSTMPTSSSSPLAASTPVPIFNRSSSLRLNRSTPAGDPSRPRSSSFDPFAQGGNKGLVRSSSETLATTGSEKSRKQAPGSGESADGSSTPCQDKSSSSGGSESFASLKAKLREYRDMLLNKNKSSSSSKKYALVPSSPPPSHKPVENSSMDMTGKKGSLGRSSSLAKLMAQFQRRGSKLSLDSLQDNNWELKEAKPASPTSLTPSLDSPAVDQEISSSESASSGGDKKSIPVVRDPLGLNRPSLRPVSTNMLNQVG